MDSTAIARRLLYRRPASPHTPWLFILLLAFATAHPAAAAVVGACRFDTDTLSFAGTPAEQASCLLRPVRRGGYIALQPVRLPPVLAGSVGRPVEVDVARLRRHLAAVGFRRAGFGSIDAAVSRNVSGHAARYFVIHDTSWPDLGDAPFPVDLDASASINRLAGYAGPQSVAHAFVNRRGEVLRGHDFSVPWRATKLETLVIGEASKGLFLHIELIQPRRRDGGGALQDEAAAPHPGFSLAQYDRLALLYLCASIRAGHWMIPAFHAALDEGLDDGHDDPQNFELDLFAKALVEVLDQVNLEPPVRANPPTGRSGWAAGRGPGSRAASDPRTPSGICPAAAAPGPPCRRSRRAPAAGRGT